MSKQQKNEFQEDIADRGEWLPEGRGVRQRVAVGGLQRECESDHQDEGNESELDDVS